ncbi:hypothetical protein GCM10023205_53990 [Yinghuangia aomiensis]|uniref:Periplasmic binding protein domain-containing protein n=2 Tax=Yinghuangia aomiensis TaxID=676205 RepID=A0ABP9HUA4_9ACTN
MVLRRCTSARRSRLLVGLLATGTLVLTGCSSSDGGSAPSASGGVGFVASASVVQEAKQRDRTPPVLAANPAVAGKNVAILSLSQANESGAVPAAAAKEAAEIIGWKATIYDANSNMGAVTGLVRQATAAGANALIVVNIDCAAAAQAFREATAAGVVIVPVNGFDCDNEGSPGGPSARGFSGEIRPGGGLNQSQFWAQDGSDQAHNAIADSEDTAKIISVESTELAVEYWQAKGFNEAVAASGGSRVVQRVEFTTADFVSGRLTTMIEAALTRHPEATYIKSAFSASTIANVVPAVRASHSKIKILGGEGLQSEFDLLRKGQMLSTDATPGSWFGWAAVDTVNSLFRKTPPNDSGLQWMLVDRDNVPSTGTVQTADFRTVYRASWGVS